MHNLSKKQKVILVSVVLVPIVLFVSIWYGFNVPIKKFGTKDSCPIDSPKTYIYHIISGQGSEYEEKYLENKNLPNLGPMDGCRLLEIYELYLF